MTDMYITRYSFNIIFALIFLMIITPTSFLNYLTDAMEHIGIGSFVQSLFGNFLPAILLFCYQTYLLPVTVKFLVNKEKHISKTEKELSLLRKFFVYNIVYIFLVPLFGIQFFKIIELLVDNDLSSFEKNMVERITLSGNLFTVYIIDLAFIGNGLDLL
mmetsp:Transcript_19949/g.3254  ORF Transcript_19949/g.3254 Transcript_19949/m.3254 type:complete len:159 (+) Transcript_19949:1000-1476(+)